MGLVTLLAPKATKFAKMTQNNGNTPFNVIQGRQLLY